MSVTFSVCKKSQELYDGRMVTFIRPIYPEGFDNTPVVDPEYPEYGPLLPDCPWELNVSNQNCVDLLRTLGFSDEAQEYVGSLDPAKLLEACDGALATIHSIPELDAGTDWIENRKSGMCTVIECGRMAGYLDHRFSKLRELAVVALEHEAIIGYA